MGLNEAKTEKRILPFNEVSSVKKVFAVVSAKGGVGKSLLTVLLSVLMRRAGYTVGILDADLTARRFRARSVFTDMQSVTASVCFPRNPKPGSG